jgi:AP-1 complex subunit gamma-1
MSQAGTYVKEQILSSFVRLIATTPELQTYTVQKLYVALKDDITQEGLTLAGTWVIGEFADSLLRGGQYEEEELVKEVSESDVVDLFATILSSSYSGQTVTEYIITSAMKLTTRLNEPAQIERIRRLIQSFQANLDIEIQQRAAEYNTLFSYDQIRRGVLEKMPPPEIREEQRVLGQATKKPNRSGSKKKKPSQMTEQDMLLDLMGGSDSMSPEATTNGSQNNASLLADILGGDVPAQAPTQSRSNVDSIMDLFNPGPSAPSAAAPSSASSDLFGGMGSPPAAAHSPLPASAHAAYNKNGLNITLQLQRNQSGIQILGRFRNTGGVKLTNVSLQAAVPKTQRLQLQQISTTEIGPGDEATQQLRVVGVNGVSRCVRA